MESVAGGSTGTRRPRGAALERLHDELSDVTDLPTIPEIALRVLQTMEAETASAKSLGVLIARDQVLTARLLRLANSACFAVRRSLTDIPDVITRLGFARVRDIVLSMSVWDAFEPLDAEERLELWAHSTMVAAAAQTLARAAGADPTEAYTAGLLHDVGKLVFGLRIGKPYWSLLRDVPSGDALAAAEEREYGCHHATVGGWLLECWRLPPPLVAPVASHHAPLASRGGPARPDVSHVVAVADRLVDATDADGVVAPDTLRAVRAAAPGLIEGDRWRDVWAAAGRERLAMVEAFGSVGSPRMPSSHRAGMAGPPPSG